MANANTFRLVEKEKSSSETVGEVAKHGNRQVR